MIGVYPIFRQPEFILFADYTIISHQTSPYLIRTIPIYYGYDFYDVIYIALHSIMTLHIPKRGPYQSYPKGQIFPEKITHIDIF